MLVKHIVSLTLFVALMLLINYAHFRFLPVNVIFYTALLDACAAAIVAAAVVWLVIFKKNIHNVVFAQLLLIFFLVGYIYAISMPTLIDRSLSMYVLEKLQQHNGGIKKEAFSGKLIEEYAREHHLGHIRLTEQLESGMVELQGDCVILTTRGQAMASATRWYRKNFLPPHRLLMGQYTDALVDPFQQHSQLGASECQGVSR